LHLLIRLPCEDNKAAVVLAGLVRFLKDNIGAGHFVSKHPEAALFVLRTLTAFHGKITQDFPGNNNEERQSARRDKITNRYRQLHFPLRRAEKGGAKLERPLPLSL
jgi:hypothetical protein